VSNSNMRKAISSRIFGNIFRIVSLPGLLVLFIVFFIFSNGRIANLDNLTNLGTQVAVLMVVSLGQTMVILIRGIDLSTGAVISLAGVFTASFVASYSFNPLLAIVAGVMVGSCIGVVNGLLITRLEIPSVIATLGMSTVATGVLLSYTHGYPIYNLGQYTDIFTTIGSGRLFGIPILIIVTVFVWIGVWLLMTRTVFGRHIYAIGGNKEASRLSGINVLRTELIVYVLCSSLSAFAGVLLMSRLGVGHPLAGDSFLLDPIAAVLIGGTSMAGGEGGAVDTLVGVLIMGVLNNGLYLIAIDAFSITLIKGLIIIGAVATIALRKRRRG